MDKKDTRVYVSIRYSLFLFFKELFIFSWLHWVFIAACRLSLVAGYSVVVLGLLTAVASLIVEHGGRGWRRWDCSAEDSRLTGSAVAAHRLSYSLACGIFPDQGLNLCPCIGRQIPNPWTTREVWIVFK